MAESTSTSFNNSNNTSNSTSTSKPSVTQTPQSLFSLQLSQLLSQLGQSEQQWAMQQYAKAGQVTDDQINNYISQAQQGNQLATNTLDRYGNLFAPMEDQYARNAGAYDSQGRIQNEMGASESRAMQAGKQAKDQTEQQLQAFGIDPSSGRYQDLIRASNTADAASAAAAGETARRAVEAEGDRRRVNAIQMGEQLPAAAVNAMNSAYQGIAGAENSELGLLNTGANITTASSKFFDPATHLTNPVTGQNTNSQSTGRGNSNGGSNSFSTSPTPNSGSSRGGGGNPGGGGGGNPSQRGVLPDTTGGGQPPLDSFGGINPGPGIKPGLNVQQTGDPFQTSYGQVGQDPVNTNPWEQASDPYSWGAPPNSGGFTADNTGGYFGGTPPAPADWSQNVDTSYQPPQDNYNFPDPSSGGNADYGNSYSQPYDDNSSYDYSNYGDYGNDNYGYSSDYARGGVVGRGRAPQRPGQGQRQGQRPGGGYVPPQMSPSRGRVTDDIPAVIPQNGGRAQINAGEFVLPRDVVAWKGKEFFQKMIQQARKRRMGQAA